MKTKQLTKAERDWLNKLQAVLDECPSDRLGAFTIGDPSIYIYDSRFESEINEIINSGNTDFCAATDKLGSDLSVLRMPFAVHSTAG
ncbi:MAG: hypothetical protein AWU57_605 [Marinobacter sp. T13-3]|nr:MAG: hypothetical protein AWU57_605 [Marinobacter sp. T13-3]